MRKIFLLPILFFTSCGLGEVKNMEHSPVRNVSRPLPADTTQNVLRKMVTENMEHTPSRNDFIFVVKGINISNINQYIYSENGTSSEYSGAKGLWLISSQGAMPHIENVSQVDKNFPVDFSAVKNEELPKVNCDSKSFWTKEGTFAMEINSFKDEKIWTYCGLTKEDEAKIAELAQTISWTVINTSLNARYYFSLINGKWYLTFVDLRKPCEA
jgi:hypothetical protein